MLSFKRRLTLRVCRPSFPMAWMLSVHVQGPWKRLARAGTLWMVRVGPSPFCSTWNRPLTLAIFMLAIFNLWDPLSKLVSFKTLPQKSHVPFDVPASEHIGNNMPQWFWQSLPRASGILWHLVLTTWINIEVLQAVFAPLISYATNLLFLVSPFKSMHPGPASGKPVSTLSSVSCSKKALERPIETPGWRRERETVPWR